MIHNGGQLIAQEHGDDGGRRFVRAETVIVAGVGGAHAQKARVLIHRLHHRGEHEQEHPVLLRIAARLQQIMPGIRRQRPVVVFAAAVDPRKGFFMQQAYQPVTQGNLLHDVP